LYVQTALRDPHWSTLQVNHHLLWPSRADNPTQKEDSNIELRNSANTPSFNIIHSQPSSNTNICHPWLFDRTNGVHKQTQIYHERDSTNKKSYSHPTETENRTTVHLESSTTPAFFFLPYKKSRFMEHALICLFRATTTRSESEGTTKRNRDELIRFQVWVVGDGEIDLVRWDLFDGGKIVCSIESASKSVTEGWRIVIADECAIGQDVCDRHVCGFVVCGMSWKLLLVEWVEYFSCVW
jgi:hypothetical protein